MSNSFKTKKNSQLRVKITNAFMLNGKKWTTEKILLQASKRAQKITKKNFRSIFHLALINSTLPFEINEQSLKKGKRKSTRNIPSFISNDSLRVMKTLKRLKKISKKSKGSISFCDSFVKEILSSSTTKGVMLEKKEELHKQILSNKRYLSRFRW